MSKSKPKVTFSKLVSTGLRHRLFNALEKETVINAEGRVSWNTGASVDQYISVLRDAFEFPDQLSARECARIVWGGLIDARRGGAISDSSVLAEFQRQVDNSLAQPLRNYSMWSRVSYKPQTTPSGRRFRYSDVILLLSENLPKYMRLSAHEMARSGPHSTHDKPGFGFIIANTKARNEIHAADKIFRSVELFLSTFNLVLRPWNIMGSEQKPEAKLLMGPYQFFFEQKKSIQSSNTWFNPVFRNEYWNSTASDSRKIFESASTVRRVLSKLENHPLKRPLSSALLMMNEGMESPNMSRRTLRYWTALERLFQADDERATYDKIIKRATYLDVPTDLARAKLHRLARIRNRYVHMGTSENEHHQLTQYLADHVRRHLFYILFNGDDFVDHAEFLEMTDLPSEANALARRRQAIDRRERMIELGRHRQD